MTVSRRTYRSDLSDARWALIEPILSEWRAARTARGLDINQPIHDLREIVILVAQADSTPDEPQLVDGTVERFEAFPELGLRLIRISLPTKGLPGAPVVNAAGELVGLLTGGDGDGGFVIATDTARSLLGRAATD